MHDNRTAVDVKARSTRSHRAVQGVKAPRFSIEAIQRLCAENGYLISTKKNPAMVKVYSILKDGEPITINDLALKSGHHWLTVLKCAKALGKEPKRIGGCYVIFKE